jgi:hypothetical protein
MEVPWNKGRRTIWVAAKKLGNDMVFVAVAVCVVNQEAGFADEVVMVIGDGIRLRKSHGVADVAKSVIAVGSTS